MEALWFIIGILATWRFAYMLQNETGPFAIFSKLQAYLAKFDDKPGSFADGFFCFYCLSVWVAIPISALIGVETLAQLIAYTLALSAGAIFINIVHEKYNSDS